MDGASVRIDRGDCKCTRKAVLVQARALPTRGGQLTACSEHFFADIPPSDPRKWSSERHPHLRQSLDEYVRVVRQRAAHNASVSVLAEGSHRHAPSMHRCCEPVGVGG